MLIGNYRAFRKWQYHLQKSFVINGNDLLIDCQPKSERFHSREIFRHVLLVYMVVQYLLDMYAQSQGHRTRQMRAAEYSFKTFPNAFCCERAFACSRFPVVSSRLCTKLHIARARTYTSFTSRLLARRVLIMHVLCVLWVVLCSLLWSGVQAKLAF